MPFLARIIVRSNMEDMGQISCWYIDPEGDRIFPSQQPRPLSLALEKFDLDLSAYVHLKSAGKNSTSAI